VAPRRILHVCIGLGLVVWLMACATVPSIESPRVSVVALQPVEVTPLEQTYRIRVRLQNPNDHDLDVTGLSYKLEVNRAPLLEGVSGAAFTVPRYSEAVVDVSGVSTFFGFIRQIQALEQQAKPEVIYKLTGKISIRNRVGTLPFEYEGTLTLPAARQSGSS
jgi:LEA14-like dessication related protein